jgi:hypothetical protein
MQRGNLIRSTDDSAHENDCRSISSKAAAMKKCKLSKQESGMKKLLDRRVDVGCTWGLFLGKGRGIPRKGLVMGGLKERRGRLEVREVV